MSPDPRARLMLFDRQLGAFARIFPRPNARELADAFVAAQLTQVQLNIAALGLPTIPDAAQLAGIDLEGIADALEHRYLELWGVSVTYNMAHPDEERRRAETERAAGYIRALGTIFPVAATLCTGTRDPDNMWAKHPENRTEAAWAAMLRSMRRLIPAAEAAGILLAVEPEPGNVVTGARDALRLIADLGDDARHIGFILDPANLLAETPRDDRPAVLRDAFRLLGDRTICVHAKDLVPWAETLAGRGEVDYGLVLELHAQYTHDVPVIIQDADEREAPIIRDMLRDAFLANLSRIEAGAPAVVSAAPASTHEAYAAAAGWEIRNPQAAHLVVLLHGLGGDRNQPLGLLAGGLRDVTILAPDARAHGATEIIGEPQDFRFASMTEDLVALLETLGQAHKPTYLAGISMGAAVALDVLLAGSLDIRGAALIRPAFDASDSPENLAAMPIVARLLEELGPRAGAAAYAQTDRYRSVRAESERGAAGELAQFAAPRATERAIRLREIASNRAFSSSDDLSAITVPTLVVGAPRDPEHPLALAESWAAGIPSSELVVVPARDDDLAGYERAIREVVHAHLAAVFAPVPQRSVAESAPGGLL
jgi:sugar phosphate isomerase/epimerase/pimeloyl-ACP methyl ester carboxylesterase